MDVLEEFCDSYAIWRIAFIVAKMTGNRKEHVLGKYRIPHNTRQECKLQAKAGAKSVSYKRDAHPNIAIFSKNS